MPTNHGSPLQAALSYYSAIVTVNAEGDSSVSEDTLEGLGTKGLLLHALFGSILRVAQPPPVPSAPFNTPGSKPGNTTSPHIPERVQPPLHYHLAHDEMAAAAAGSISNAAVATTGAIRNSTALATRAERRTRDMPGTYKGNSDVDPLDTDNRVADSQLQFGQGLSTEEDCQDEAEPRLMSLLPEPGYFAAGALSGGISRTATAPIDRLKVYLLVDNKVKPNVVLAAAKAGDGLAAVKQAGTPVANAVRDLYKTGGLRTFFAGRVKPLLPRPPTDSNTLLCLAATWAFPSSSCLIH